MKKYRIYKVTDKDISNPLSLSKADAHASGRFTFRRLGSSLLTGFVLLVLLVTWGCKEEWDEHFTEEPEIYSSLNLLDYLKTKSEYSAFVEVLESTGVSEELTRDQNLTVWVVNNEGMAALAQEEVMSDSFIISYHINSLAVSREKLYHGQRLPSLNGKYVSVTFDGDVVKVADSEVLVPDQFCQNGVVHEINKLMSPTISIYEYLNGLGDEYSIVVDSIFSMNDTIFDINSSTPVGVDITGNTVYDSVYAIDNPLFEIVDFRSEFEQITMFLPDNDAVNNCFDSYIAQIEGIGRTVEKADTVLAFDWILSALFYDGIIENYGAELDLESIDGKVWRTSVQKVKSNPKMMSNGIVYDVDKMKIPNNIFITRIKSLFHYIEYVPDADRPSLIKFFNATEAVPAAADNVSFPSIGIPSFTYKVLKLTGDKTDELPLAFEANPIKLETLDDNTIVGSEMFIPPGEYKFYLGFWCKNHPLINVYFNDELIAEGLDVSDSNPWNYDRVNETVAGTKYDGLGGLVNIINVPGEDMASVRIKIEFNSLGKGSLEELKPYHWALIPTENNY